MKRRNFSACCLAAAILLLATLCGCAGGGAPGISALPQQDSLTPSSRAADGSVTYLVLAKQGKYDKVKSRVTALGAGINQEMPELDALTASSADPAFVASLSSDSYVDGVAEDQDTSALDETFIPVDAGTITSTDPSFPTPQDSLYGLQWDIRRIGGALDKAWAVTSGNHNIRVAVMDTGICAEHPDLAPNLLVSLSRNFVTNSPPQDPADLSLRDLAGHGTFTAGQIAGAFGGGEIVGIGPGLSIVSVKMINKNGRLWFSWALPALYYAAVNRFEVINMSWTGTIDTSTGTGNLWWKAFQRATHFADAQGCLQVAAAGNNGQRLTGTNIRRLPAELPEVIAVSATTYQDRLAPYSNYGVSTIVLSAPGGSLPPGADSYPYLCPGAFSPDAVSGKFYAWAAGTSFSAPKVSGTAGLILSKNRIPVSQLKATLQQTSEDLGKPGRDEQFGFGLVDANRAVR